ncbi:prolyl oligopeptidase family serine peptidase [Shewanella gaetbuli]|uniref:S9 family peptidase n=1 Tax=Shewanella gaetbuli TaxID=220752 RepID=A0A9X2CLP0_9GAMM|nr:S9 family peptidase [Shewanella gaetbuli]
MPTPIKINEPLNQAPLIEMEKFFDVDKVSSVQSSFDGKWLAFRKEYLGVNNIYLLKAGAPIEQAVAVTTFADPVLSFIWSNNDNRLFFSQDKGGNEQYQIFQLSLFNQANELQPQVVQLTHNPNVKYRLKGQASANPELLNIKANHDEPSRSDFYNLNLKTGELQLVHKNTQAFTDAIFNENGQLVLGVSAPLDNTESLFAYIDGQWELMQQSEPNSTIDILNYNSKKQLAYISSNAQGRDKTALLALSLRDKTITEVHADPEDEANIYNVKFNQQGEPIAVSYYGGRLRTYPLSAEFAKPWQQIQSIFGEEVEVHIKETNQQSGLWHLTVASDVESTRHYQFNTQTGEAKLLLKIAPKISADRLSKRHVAHYQARDGVIIQAYLTLPKQQQSNLPTIILPHGGPWARDYWTLDSGYFNSVAQFLANRGYAVLQPNFRASTGFGKQFIKLANKNWGTGSMQHDLTDGVEYLIRQGIADPKRLGIMGGSYGGYAALAGATFTPDLYKAVISYVGPSSLISLMESFPPYWRPYMGDWIDGVGDIEIPEQRSDIEARSPINYVDRIKAPVLLVQGANDPRVPQQESDNMAKKMHSQSLPVEYILAKDEGHGFVKRDNKLAYIVAMERFFAKHLGGRQSTNVDEKIVAHLKSLQVDINNL